MTNKILICECKAEIKGDSEAKANWNLKRHKETQRHKDLILEAKKDVKTLSNLASSGDTKPKREKPTNSERSGSGGGNPLPDKTLNKTKAQFRKVLNEKYKTKEEFIKSDIAEEIGKINFPSRRGFGDYLYHQNRELFDALFLNWKDEK